MHNYILNNKNIVLKLVTQIICFITLERDIFGLPVLSVTDRIGNLPKKCLHCALAHTHVDSVNKYIYQSGDDRI